MQKNETLKDNTILAPDAEQPTTEHTPSTAPDYLPAGYLAAAGHTTPAMTLKYMSKAGRPLQRPPTP